MRKLNVAIIGQGRSGFSIHGAFFLSGENDKYNVKYVVDYDEYRRQKAERHFIGCKTLVDYKELFAYDDIPYSRREGSPYRPLHDGTGI
ncbi:MAG: hypothetical protein II350_05475 [Clostridia bacterium]|nr:hypothetical protein [Clostridia bacterium]